MPRFAVIVPAYNASATLRETLDSIAAQEFGDWECVVVDDGSKDDTAAITSEYVERDPRFRLHSQENTGTAGAYSAGVAIADSDLLIICASDDLLLPAHLSTMDDLVSRNPDCGLFSSNGDYLFHESGYRRPVHVGEPWDREREITLEEAIHASFFSVGVVFRRSTAELVGGHRRGVYVDDYDFWLRAMAAGVRLRYTPEILALHRVSSFQQTSSIVRVLESTIEVYQHLLATADLSDEHCALAEQRIAEETVNLEAARRGEPIEGFPIPERLPEFAADRFRRRLGEMTSEGFADGVIRGMQALARPLRRLRGH